MPAHFIKYCVGIVGYLFCVICQAQPDFLILDGIRADQAIYLVGEQGQIISSQDGDHWQHHDSTTDVLLTAITQTKSGRLIVVGHDALILISDDAGKQWQVVYQDPEFEAPLLDVISVGSTVYAVGAYGQLLQSTDNGLNWQAVEFILEHDLTQEQTGFLELADLHLNAIHTTNQGRLLIPTEAGYVFYSDDQAVSWQVIKSPYEGSFFGIQVMDHDHLLVYGLRGHVFRLELSTQQWKAIETHSNELLQSSLITDAGQMIISGYGSTVLMSTDNGQSFKPLAFDQKANLTSVIPLDAHTLLLGGDHGVTSMQLMESAP